MLDENGTKRGSQLLLALCIKKEQLDDKWVDMNRKMRVKRRIYVGIKERIKLAVLRLATHHCVFPSPLFCGRDRLFLILLPHVGHILQIVGIK